MPLTTNLQIWTADTTTILCSSINFTADGACLNNGGGTAIAEAPGGGADFNALSYLTQTQNPS
jgi:hypothetical protein